MSTPRISRAQRLIPKQAAPTSKPYPSTPAGTPSLRMGATPASTPSLRIGYVYILTNHTRMFYVGMTDDIHRRTLEHKTGFHKDSFTDKYQLNQLVYFEEAIDAAHAEAREKQLKGWSRKKKINLIESLNPHWTDLSERWYTSEQLAPGNKRPQKKWNLSFDYLA